MPAPAPARPASGGAVVAAAPPHPDEHAEREAADVRGPRDLGVAADQQELGSEPHEQQPDRLDLPQQHRAEEDDRLDPGRRPAHEVRAHHRRDRPGCTDDRHGRLRVDGDVRGGRHDPADEVQQQVAPPAAPAPRRCCRRPRGTACSRRDARCSRAGTSSRARRGAPPCPGSCGRPSEATALPLPSSNVARYSASVSGRSSVELARDRGVVDDEAKVLLVDALDDAGPVEPRRAGRLDREVDDDARGDQQQRDDRAPAGSGSRRPSGSRTATPRHRTGRAARVRPARSTACRPTTAAGRAGSHGSGCHPGGRSSRRRDRDGRPRGRPRSGVGHRCARAPRRAASRRLVPTDTQHGLPPSKPRTPDRVGASRSGCRRATAG